MKPKSFLPIFALIALLALSLGVYLYSKKKPPINPNIVFLTETFDLIQTNYWDKLEDQDLIDIFLAATRKFGPAPQLVAAKDKDELFKLLDKILNQDNTPTIADAVLQNLKPPGRSRLYTQKLKQDLSNTVNNIDPTTNHYDSLDIDKDANPQEVNQAYQEKSATASPEEKKVLDIAYNTLKDKSTRETYNKTGADPTMPHRQLTDQIYYIGIKKFSPTTLQELDNIAQETNQYPKLNTLILDLQGNIGGAIDGLPYFLGPFIGPDQYAYQFLQQRKIEDFKTKTSWLNGLVKFKKTIILVDGQTQSSAEVMASVLKKYNIGVLVGTTTKGWGTIEKVFPLQNQISDTETYSVFLVHHLTLREDGQPIQDHGVDPHIDVTKPNWQQELLNYYNDPLLITQLKKLLTTP